MANTGSVVTRTVVQYLSEQSTGLGAVFGDIAQENDLRLATVAPAHIVNQNVSFELSERSQVVKYPVVHVYTDRIRNLLTEKFRTFSGKIRTVAEVRVSQDRIEGLEERLRLYVDAVTRVLDQHRGSWGDGAFFAGQYEVTIEPVKHGGKNFLQVAKVTFEVDLSA